MLSTMTSRLNLLLLSLLIFALPLRSVAQVSAVATTDARPRIDVLLDARVLGIPAQGLSKLGLILSEVSRGATEGPSGFAVVLPEGESESLLADLQTTIIHSLKLQGTPASPIKFRVDTRVKVNSNTLADNPPYFELGLALEVTPTVFPNRNIALSSRSILQIRRGPPPVGGISPVVFETQPIRHDIQIPEGKTILLGGFLTKSNSAGLPSVPASPGNALISYVLGQSPRKGDETELVVLLTPHLSGTVDTVVENGTPAAAAPASNVESAKVPVITFAPPPSFSAPVTKPISIGPPVSPPPSVKPAEASVVPATPPKAVIPAPAPPAIAAASPPPLAIAGNVGVATKPNSSFYSIQVGAFASSANAETLVSELKSKKFEEVFIDKADSGKTPYRVRVGRLQSSGAARQLQGKLSDQGFDSFLVPPNSP